MRDLRLAQQSRHWIASGSCCRSGTRRCCGAVLLPELIYFCSLLLLPCALRTRLPGSPGVAGSLWLLKVECFTLPTAPSPWSAGGWQGGAEPLALACLAWTHEHPLAGGTVFWAACNRAVWGDAASSWLRIEAAAAGFAAEQILCKTAEGCCSVRGVKGFSVHLGRKGDRVCKGNRRAERMV